MTYGVDEKGFYNLKEFERTGEKYRPLVISQQRLVVDSPALANHREHCRETVQALRGKKYATTR